MVVCELELDLFWEELPELYVRLMDVFADVLVPKEAPMLPDVELEPELYDLPFVLELDVVVVLSVGRNRPSFPSLV